MKHSSSCLIYYLKTTGFPVTEEQEYPCEDENDVPALSLSLGQELRVDQSILRNVDIELQQKKTLETGEMTQCQAQLNR